MKLEPVVKIVRWTRESRILAVMKRFWLALVVLQLALVVGYQWLHVDHIEERYHALAFEADDIIANNSVSIAQPSVWSAGSNSTVKIANNGIYSWSSTAGAGGAADVAIARNAAGLLEVDNGTAGTFADLKIRNMTVTGTYAGGVFTAGAAGIVPSSGGGSVNFLRADGTWAAATILTASLEWFGDGTDGSPAAFDGTTAILGMTPASNVYTMTRDLSMVNATINTGVTLKTNGFRLLVSGTLTLSGTAKVSWDGAAGGNATSTTAGAGATGNTGQLCAGSSSGGNGGQGTTGSVGSGLTNGYPNTTTSGGAAGAAGAGNGGNGNTNAGGGGGGAQAGVGGSAGGGVTQIAATQGAAGIVQLQQCHSAGTTPTLFGGGAGGGGGGSSNGAGGGGGGGAGGGDVFVAAWKLAGSGTITSLGGVGGNGAQNAGAGVAGGGGGGGGGTLTVMFCSNLGTVTASSAGGAGGAGAGGGGTGGTGGNGERNIYNICDTTTLGAGP